MTGCTGPGMNTGVPNPQFGKSAREPREGRYDVRKGAEGYGAIIGTVGSLAVTAIVVVFTVPQHLPDEPTALATGLLVVGFMGSLLGAFGFAALSAEQDPTANLVAASMYFAVPTALAVMSLLAAFQVLASFYVPASSELFVWATAVGSVFGVLITALTVADAASSHPTDFDIDAFEAWVKHQWLKDRKQATRASNKICVSCLIPVGVAVLLREVGQVHVPLSVGGIDGLVGFGMALCVLGSGLGYVSAAHPYEGNEQVALKMHQAWTAPALIAGFATAVLLCLP